MCEGAWLFFFCWGWVVKGSPINFREVVKGNLTQPNPCKDNKLAQVLCVHFLWVFKLVSIRQQFVRI